MGPLPAGKGGQNNIMLILTDQEIKEDIEEFQFRISIARQKIIDLPAGHIPVADHKKREKIRRDLQDDIRHIEKMISIALEALNE